LEAFGLPVVIKAATQGSSIGVTIPKEAKEIEPALKDAFAYSENVLVEQCIQGKELTVALMEENGEPKPLPVIGSRRITVPMISIPSTPRARPIIIVPLLWTRRLLSTCRSWLSLPTRFWA